MRKISYFTSIDEMLSLLQAVSDGNFPSVRRNLSKGDLVSIHGRKTDDYWLINDPYTYQNLPGFDNGKFPLETIYQLFPGTSESRNRLFEEEAEMVQEDGDIPISYKVLPYSRAIETRTGVCLERSILLQLSQQERLPIFLVKGFCDFPMGDEEKQGYHAFNIALKDGQLLLLDVKPRESKDKRYNPFIVPVEGIDIATQKVVLPQNRSDGRMYHIEYLDEFLG
ncbi:MAG TPA: hypothetical protein HA282_01330 [Nanoarchaeota archaeon]|nr:MAG: hypothetical protein QT01_C0003G0008 [archaeon GW2011_AR6]MBS3082365.1 hypothetical protein [Candidatus Pacearchaeota archaeon]HIH18320.1 hypothetical protein [Nanoarchaeota archaeon]HIH33862.1 hypothetical protein [Nanoarchaeota archaeon]HIH65841.1 hypothetical protein [Nanoarchaeota archaeon]